jgi:tagatose 1,6-diphosphate aldolase
VREIGTRRALVKVVDKNTSPSHQERIDLLFVWVIRPDGRDKAPIKKSTKRSMAAPRRIPRVLTSVMKNWSVGKIKRMGADGVKLLLWYRPDASRDVLAHQRNLVRDVGAECRRYDIPLLLELLVYPFKGAKGHTTEYTEDKKKYPELVLQSLRDFADPEFGVDIYKVESPVVADQLPDPSADSPEARATQSLFDEISRIIDGPWVMLSAGASMDVFRRILGFAYRAGANGYLAGRAIWWPAFGLYPNLAAMGARLDSEAVHYMREINDLTTLRAVPWTQARAVSGHLDLLAGGYTFPSDYPSFECQTAVLVHQRR